MLATLLLIGLILVPAYGAAYMARRLPRRLTWGKVVLVGFCLAAFAASLFHTHGVSEADGKGYALFMWGIMPFAMIGAPVCFGFIVGALFGLYRQRAA